MDFPEHLFWGLPAQTVLTVKEFKELRVDNIKQNEYLDHSNSDLSGDANIPEIFVKYQNDCIVKIYTFNYFSVP